MTAHTALTPCPLPVMEYSTREWGVSDGGRRKGMPSREGPMPSLRNEALLPKDGLFLLSDGQL